MAEVGVYSLEEDSKLPGRTDQNTMWRQYGHRLPCQDTLTDISTKTKGLAPMLPGYLSYGKEDAARGSRESGGN